MRLESSWQKVWAGGAWVGGIPASQLEGAAGRKWGGDNIRSGGREEDFVQGLDLGQALNARQKGLESMLRDRRSTEDP